jgi:3-hydroxyacyl-CoA dehydrogenase
LHQQTGDPNFAARPVLRRLVDEGNAGAISGKGWYQFEGDYPTVVSRRDRQLGEFLTLLQQKDAVAGIGLKK